MHGKMKAVCEEFSKTAPRSKLLKPFWASLHIASNLEVQTIADNFIDLQEDRHAADYDLSRKFSRQDASIAAGQADEAIKAWSKLKTKHEELALLFALSLMLWPGLSGH